MGGAEVSQRILAERLISAGVSVDYLGSYIDPRNGTSYFETFLKQLETLGIESSISGGRISYCFHQINCLMPNQISEHDLARAFEAGVDLLITSQERSDEIARVAVRCGVRTAAWIHSVSDVGMCTLNSDVSYVLSTSRFVQQRVLDCFGIDSLLFYPPFIESKKVLNTGKYITMINPIIVKGSEILSQLVQSLPDREFMAIEGWFPISQDERLSCSNITYISKQYDMTNVFNNTRILLAPSMIEEGFGRVVVEAGLHGIPAVVNAKGGLVEALGDGGISLTSHAIDDWIKAIQSLDDIATYSLLSANAKRNAQGFIRDFIAELEVNEVL